ncbi:hypothetical protein FDF74_05060 [Clostridium niameyense]|uniref:Uncharacterized protein n=1 Tax=Clostridium niameyense TaxID=1622073 RepID=A0A6M0R8K3_9CLOT|nr:hypothetical protein [Clostridium niameyense]NEZ46583.1 hypothetical protein [Clostridium niameyense]
MSNYSLDIKGKIELSDYSNINDYINILDKRDEITINMDLKNNEDFEIICDILKRNSLNLYVQKKMGLSEYYIKAKKV